MIGACPDIPQGIVDEAVAAAKHAQPSWAKHSATQRAGDLREIGRLVRGRCDELARTISREQGKLLSLANLEVKFTADYMAEWARRIDGAGDPARSRVTRVPASEIPGLLRLAQDFEVGMDERTSYPTGSVSP